MASAMGGTATSDLMLLLFNNTNWANLGDATGLRGSTVAGSFFVALSTGALTAASAQNTTEAAYTGYSRQAVARSGAGWTVSGTAPATAANAAAITYTVASGGTPETETYFSIGRDTSGAGEVIFWGQLTAPLVVNNGITPQFAIGACAATMT